MYLKSRKYPQLNPLRHSGCAKRFPYPKVRRVYIAGKVKGSQIGTFEKRSGKQVHGVKIVYEQSPFRPRTQGVHRPPWRYPVPRAGGAGRDAGRRSSFSKIIELPGDAQGVQFHTGKLPKRYRDALQDVRLNYVLTATVPVALKLHCYNPLGM